MIREPYIKQRIPKKYFVIIFLALALLAGLVFYVFQKKASAGFGYLNEQLAAPEYIEDPQYCMEDSDCMIFHEICGSKPINKHNFDHKADEENIKNRDLARCAAFTDLINPRCENNLCIGDLS